MTMKNKINESKNFIIGLILGSAIAGVIIISLLMPIWNNKSGVDVLKDLLQDNKETISVGDAPSGGTIEGDMVYWENDWARLEVYPHTSNELVTHVQYANVTWKLPDNNIDLVFRFPNKLNHNNSDIWLWKNTTKTRDIPEFGMITKSYVLQDILDYQPLSSPPDKVDFGATNSTHFMIVIL